MSNNPNLLELNTPVDAMDFIETFTKKFHSWGNIVTPALQETWKLNCLALNNAAQARDKVIKYIVSAPTGSAKTENTITYCAMLPSEVKVLISTNLTDEADRLASHINQEAKDQRAVSFHSKKKITLAEASEYQIVIVSHEFYRRHHAGDGQWLLLGENRDLIIIDEALDTMKELSVSSNEISRALTIFKHISFEHASSKHFQRELLSLGQVLDLLNNAGGGTKLIRSNKMWEIRREDGNIVKCLSIEMSTFLFFPPHLENNTSIKYNLILTGIDNAAADSSIKKEIIQTLRTLDELKDRQTYITANKGTYSFNRVVDTTPSKSLVCFDATADVNKAYDLRAKYFNDLIKVPKVPNVRDYSAATMHIASVNTGKKSLDLEMVTTILSNVTLGDKTLIVTHKSNESLFKEFTKTHYPNHTIDVAHWNALTGLNSWQDFDTCIIAGLNHKPKSFSQNRVIVNTDETTAFGEEQANLNKAIRQTDIVAEIVQAVNRIRVRRITTDSGGCASANIYITLPLMDSMVYKQLIQTQMYGINIVQWGLPAAKAKSNNLGHFDTIINYLQGNMKTGDMIAINAPREALNINPESYRTIIGKAPIDKQKLKDKLEPFGFEILEMTEMDKRGRGKKNPAQYIRRVR
ncbi:MAG: DEAD/DEAH box helicase family protein [Ignisphaera sp.]|nr:DEAD/DEAH box helicase family protein [Ignisphaera sp.]